MKNALIRILLSNSISTEHKREKKKEIRRSAPSNNQIEMTEMELLHMKTLPHKEKKKYVAQLKKERERLFIDKIRGLIREGN